MNEKRIEHIIVRVATFWENINTRAILYFIVLNILLFSNIYIIKFIANFSLILVISFVLTILFCKWFFTEDHCWIIAFYFRHMFLSKKLCEINVFIVMLTILHLCIKNYFILGMLLAFTLNFFALSLHQLTKKVK